MELKAQHTLYDVANNSAANRTIQNANGRTVTIRGGETLSVTLTDKQVTRLERDKSMILTCANSNAVPELPPPPPPSVEKTVAEQTEELLEMSSGKMQDFTQFFVRSKALIGDKWPGGVPSKTKIRKMLTELLAEQE